MDQASRPRGGFGRPGLMLPEHEEFLGRDPESEDEEDDVIPVKKAPTRSAYEKELGKLLKQSGRPPAAYICRLPAGGS